MSFNEFTDKLHLWILKPIQNVSGNGVAYKVNGWSCPQCTYYMETNKAQCTMCGHRKEMKVSTKGRNQCGAIWHYSLIKQILLHSVDHKESEHDFDFSKFEALSARNTLQSGSCVLSGHGLHGKAVNVQKCGKCGTVHFQYEDAIESVCGQEDYAKLRTKCIMCSSHFCWNCGVEYPLKSQHICDSDKLKVYKETVGILAMCPLKTIGDVDNVPSIRACPNPDCGQLITHWEECKHMECQSCFWEFCFICMLPKEDNGDWQCGEYDDICNVAPRQTLQHIFDDSNATITLKKSFQLF